MSRGRGGKNKDREKEGGWEKVNNGGERVEKANVKKRKMNKRKG